MTKTTGIKNKNLKNDESKDASIGSLETHLQKFNFRFSPLFICRGSSNGNIMGNQENISKKRRVTRKHYREPGEHFYKEKSYKETNIIGNQENISKREELQGNILYMASQKIKNKNKFLCLRGHPVECT